MTTRQNIPVISGRQKDNPRTETGVFKYPELLRTEITRVSEREHRSASTTIYLLLVRGLKAYEKDHKLFEDDNELEFLEKKRAQR